MKNELLINNFCLLISKNLRVVRNCKVINQYYGCGGGGSASIYQCVDVDGWLRFYFDGYD
jgi:hypothetical protein